MIKALKKSRQPSIFEWLFCGAMVAFGVYCLLNVTPWEETKESDLLAAQGMPSQAKMTTVRGRYGQQTYVLDCKVGDYHAHYASGDPHASEVQSALQSGRPVKAWFAKRHTLFGGDSLQLCKLNDGSRDILATSETDAANQEIHKHAGIVFWVIIALGGFGLMTCWQQQQNFAASGARR
jgi:hypothetical protein